MTILINGQSPESLGISADAITLEESTLVAGVLSLGVVARDYDADTGLAHGGAVTLTVNNVQRFSGKVTMTPRFMAAASEGWRYEVRDAWDELDRLIYQETRTYADVVTPGEDDDDSDVEEVDAYIAHVIFPNTERLGDRIKKIIQYAIGASVDIAIGTIAPGISWYTSEYKAMTCGEMIRDIMRLMPEYVCWLDTRANPPQFNLKTRASLASISYDITQGFPNKSHQITELQSEKVTGVMLQYEKPITVDSDTYTQLTIDEAPEDLNTRAVGVLIEPIPLQGANIQSEYAPITTVTIPQADADEDTIKEWWISRTPELASIADAHTMAALRDALELATDDVADENVVKHNLKIINDEVARPDPVNPNADPVVQSTKVDDYPREIIEGSLPDWAGKRYRLVRATVTMAISVADLDAIADAGLKKQMQEIFNLPKTFQSDNWMTANFSGEVTGTNARTKNYRRVTTFDQGETPPTGIAAELLAQLNTQRFVGSFVIGGREASTTPELGKKVNFPTGMGTVNRPEWAIMGESIQTISSDFQSGDVSFTFGPSEQMGATDMIERLRAARRNTHSHGLNNDQPVQEGVGGAVAGVVKNFSRVSGGGGETAGVCILGFIQNPDAPGMIVVPGAAMGPDQSILLEDETVAPATDTHEDVYVKVSYTVATDDGVLIPGGTLDAAVFQSASTGGDAPNAGDPTGVTVYYLGRVTNTADAYSFSGDCGNLSVRICPSGATVYRS